MKNLVSIDLETTGLDPNRHQILSIGAVCPVNHAEFYEEVAHKELIVDKFAGKMNKDLLFNDGNEIGLAMIYLRRWLIKNYTIPRDLIILGKQPSFDRAFLLLAMKNVATHGFKQAEDFPFSHRCLDINSILLYNAVRQQTTFADERTALEETVKDQMIVDEKYIKEHNALHDARWNVYALEELLK